MKNKSSERLKNYLLFKVYATDEEMEEVLPFAGLIILVLAAAYGIARLSLGYKTMRLGKHFTLDEFTQSQTAARKGLTIFPRPKPSPTSKPWC
ncbi:MAG: hypothetical protein U0Y68_20690 [Blastocatellia bacterium]